MRYFLVAGEASGDIHGAHLAEAILKEDAQAQFAFCGGEQLARITGREPVVHYRSLAIMGFVEVLLQARRVLQCQRKALQAIKEFAPDTLILIDSSGFNLPIARALQGTPIRIYYYIPPKVWAWNPGRAKPLGQFTEGVFPILPFEEPFLKERGVKASYLGNPLLDELPLEPSPLLPSEREEARCSLWAAITSGNGCPKREGAPSNLHPPPLIALIPGSRRQEVTRNLPLMLRVAEQLPNYHFVITGAPSLPDALYHEQLEKASCRERMHLLRNATHLAMRACDAGLVTSGTATLEAALLGLPQVVVYRGNPLTIWIGRRLVHVQYISLVNLVANRSIVPELIQGDATLQNTLSHLRDLLPGQPARGVMIEGYREVRTILGSPGVSQRVARAILMPTLGKE